MLLLLIQWQKSEIKNVPDPQLYLHSSGDIVDVRWKTNESDGTTEIDSRTESLTIS